MRRTLLALALILPFALPQPSLAGDNDISKISSDVHVSASQQVGDVDTVNGDVRIDDNASVEDVSTVNGKISMGAHAKADKLETVNGAITLANDAHVKETVNAVNGSIELSPDADVGGRLSNVNGGIRLDAAHVGGGLKTVASDITVGANSHVEGGILVEKPNGLFHWNGHTPLVVIGPHAVVKGTLEFQREVELKVSDSAQIGPVKGATPVKFSGDMP